MSKLIRRSVLLLLAVGLVATVKAVPVDLDWDLDNSERRVTTTTTSTTTPAPTSSGWGWPGSNESGQTVGFGQTIDFEDVAANNTVENPSYVIVESGIEGPANAGMENIAAADVTFQINAYGPGGGDATGDAGTVDSSGTYTWLGQGGGVHSVIAVTGADYAEIYSDPTATAAMSADEIISSSSGQVTNGTNVNPGANSGWGWSSQQSGGWRDVSSEIDSDEAEKEGRTTTTTTTTSTTTKPSTNGWGWAGSNASGSTLSASSVEIVSGVAQVGSASEDIYVNAYGDDMEVNVNSELLSPVDFEMDTDGVSATGANSGTAGTEEQDVEMSSDPYLSQSIHVEHAGEITVSAEPSTTVNFSIGNGAISEFVTITNGTNLVNNGGWGWGGNSNGWSQPSTQGWGQPSTSTAGWGPSTTTT